MKKLISIATTAITLVILPIQAFAQDKGQIGIVPPDQGFKSIGDFLTNSLSVAFAVAIVVVLVMLIWGAFEWITSGGDKEAVGKARGRIINALIGLAVLAVAYALARVAGQFLGFNDLSHITIPAPKTLDQVHGL